MLDQLPAGEAWLNKFPLVDRQVGRQLLRSLNLVSNSQFERGLDDVLDQLLGETGNETISLLTVPEMVSSLRRTRYPDKIFRRPGSSSDRLRHYIENYARVQSARVRAHQTVESMRAERIRNVVLVEDFIGSGSRIVNHIRKALHPSIKSWISYRWTRLWVVAYGALSEGISAVERCGYRLSSKQIKLVMPASYPGQKFTDAVKEFCRRQAHRTIRSSMPLGFGAGGANLVFEHGCPNNVPVILWSAGRGYKPLFPNRGIPTELRPAFEAKTESSAPEILWDSSQYRLALALLEEKAKGRRRGLWPLLVAVGLASRKGWDDLHIADLLGQPAIFVQRLRELAVSLGILEAENRKLTVFGRSLLQLVRTSAVKPQKLTSRNRRELSELYYPGSYEGEAKH